MKLLILLLIFGINDWKQPYNPVVERTVGSTTYGTYIGGGYTVRRIGSVTIINTYTAPTYGSRHRTYRYPQYQLDRLHQGRR